MGWSLCLNLFIQIVTLSLILDLRLPKASAGSLHQLGALSHWHPIGPQDLWYQHEQKQMLVQKVHI